MLISAFFKHFFHENRALRRSAITSVPDVIFQFCFHLQKANRFQLIVLYQIDPSVNFGTSERASKLGQKMNNRRKIEYNENNRNNRKI